MKNIFLLPALLLAFMSCEKKHYGPNTPSMEETETSSDLLYYVAGSGPVSVNTFGQIYKYDGKTETLISKGNQLYSDCDINSSQTKIICLKALNNNINKKELVVLNINGDETIIVPHTNSLQWTNMNSPQWCPDGNTIVLVANGRLACINADGSNARFISKVQFTGANAYFYDCFSPNISPDGTKVAYIRRPVCDSELVVIDGINQKLPVNTELYVATIDQGFDSLYNEKRLTNNGYNLREFSPDWSPDGKRLVYCQATNDYNTSKIISCDANGNNIKLLLNDGNDNSFPKWSNDGSLIYFQAYNFSSLEGSIQTCNAIDGYGTKEILNGTVAKQYKQFCCIKK